MKTLSVDLQNCYGIKKLQYQFDFSNKNVYAIYAPNGSMKSSLAQTFKDVADGKMSMDRIFSKRECNRKITIETGEELNKDNVVVIRPYDEVLGHTEKTSTLLVDSNLRKEYEQLYIEIEKSKEAFIKALKEKSSSKKDLEKEISSTFTKSEHEFYLALIRMREELAAQSEAPYAHIKYDSIFDDKVISFLETKDFKTAIDDYIKKYNELLAASTYFKKGVFNYYNASTIAKSLAENGFFDAKHSVSLNAGVTLEITSQKELDNLVAKEKEGISNDKDLRKKYSEIDKLIQKNTTVRDFEAYLAEHEEILPRLSNIGAFKEDLWKSYIRSIYELYIDLIEKYQAAENRKKEIELEASKQKTQWEAVIDIFNGRFFVPFKLTAKNRIPVILGQEPKLTLGFTFEDGLDEEPVEKTELMAVLSTGEKKALYILNLIFEIEVRRMSQQETIFIVDDIADSFDYKNKYAIIQYLNDMTEEGYFKQIILTHNFDFFRTISSRFVGYSHCLMVSKNNFGIALNKANGIKNIFVNDWKLRFFDDQKKKIASIPFVRNIIEYTKGDKADEFLKTTSLLHWKTDSADITIGDLDNIFNSLFGTSGVSGQGHKKMVDIIHEEASNCLVAGEGINFENKVVLSIAIRIKIEKFMIDKIDNSDFVCKITHDQTPKLLKKFIELFGQETLAIETIRRVILMTPESIHLNSFMYEPILDMADDHLRKLYTDVLSLVK